MAKKTMTQTQIVAQMSETMQVPKKQAAAWFKSIADLAVKETKRTGQFVIPWNRKTRESETKGSQGTQPPDRRTDSNPEKDGGQVSSSESLPRRRRPTEEEAHKRRLRMFY